MKNGETKEEVIPPGKLPRGVTLMVRSILGINPEEISRQFEDAYKNLMGFLHHADQRMVHFASAMKEARDEIRALKEEVATLRATLNTQPEKAENDG